MSRYYIVEGLRQILAAIEIPRPRPRTQAQPQSQSSQTPANTERFNEGVEKIASAVGVPIDNEAVTKAKEAYRDRRFEEVCDRVIDLANMFRERTGVEQLPETPRQEFESCMRDLERYRDDIAP